MTLVWAYNFKQIQRLQDVFEEIVSLEIVSIIANCLFSQKKLWWSLSQYIYDICIGTLVINVFPNLSSAIFLSQIECFTHRIMCTLYYVCMN